MSVISADELCLAMENTLRDHLPTTLTQLEWDHLPAIREWQQLPSLDALASAAFPAIAVSPSGVTGAPAYSQAEQAYRTTYRIAVGVWDRGANHAETQKRARDWCAAIRLTVRAHRSLGGVALGSVWAGDRFQLTPNRDQARTFAGGAVAFDVSAFVIDTLGAAPLVATTPTPSVSVQ